MSGMERTTLRVLSYNIHKGFRAGNRAFVLRAIREAIRSVDADLVFLQEVLGHPEDGRSSRHKDWPTQPQFEFLADSIWPHFAYGKNAVYTSGHHGNALLSKYPLSGWENIDISTNRLERRGLLHGVIEIPHRKKPLHAICVHLGLFEAERATQIRSICSRIEAMVGHEEPVVIGGDFNDWRVRLTRPLAKAAELKEVFVELHGSHARTFPSWLPALPLDRIYYRGMQPHSAVQLMGQPWNQLSDHAAVYAEFTL
jgi:endonuclease/exonuclease/phosphatase family metal-dependent hydrolase